MKMNEMARQELVEARDTLRAQATAIDAMLTDTSVPPAALTTDEAATAGLLLCIGAMDLAKSVLLGLITGASFRGALRSMNEKQVATIKAPAEPSK